MTESQQFDLARRSDFEMGGVRVKPSTRMLASQCGEVKLEPRVMQVLLAFHDSAGQVLTRDDLMEKCWKGTFVGEDAVNRTIAELRRAIRETDANFAIETIPRVGYRLAFQDGSETTPGTGDASLEHGIGRRVLVAAAFTATLAGAAGVIWWNSGSSNGEEAERLVSEGRKAFLNSRPDNIEKVIEKFADATRTNPGNADAWGWLAVANLDKWETHAAANKPAILDASKHAAERSLSLDANEPNARTVMAILRFRAGDWVAFERELEKILTDHPDAVVACTYLTGFLQAVGRCKQSWDVNEVGIRHEPFAPVLQFRRGLKHWIFGRVAEADRVLEKAANLWPEHPFVWNAILTVLAYTGRSQEALAILDNVGERIKLDAMAIRLWRSGLQALGGGSEEDRRIVRRMAVDLQPGRTGIVANSIMLLSQLGEVDRAYEAAEGLLFGRGEFSGLFRDQNRNEGVYAHSGWRETQWLFTPATRAMREDARFTRFCQRLGYVDFWKQRGLGPDDFVKGSLEMG